MSWICPYQLGEFCKRAKKKCKPGMKGCVLDEKKVRFLEPEKEDNMSGEIRTLDLRPMPPFERHEKIFQIWDSMKGGETLKIINDHDPKPLRYQFEVEYKNKYEWEYEKSGPKDWIVNIKRLG